MSENLLWILFYFFEFTMNSYTATNFILFDNFASNTLYEAVRIGYLRVKNESALSKIVVIDKVLIVYFKFEHLIKCLGI